MSIAPDQRYDIRRAGPDDAAEFLRLRRVIFAAWPFAVDTDADPGWEERYLATFRRLLGRDDFVALAVDDPASPGRLAGCLTVSLEEHLPGPGNTGRTAYLADMCTDPAHEGRGIGTAMLAAARAWSAERGAGRIHLYATESGRPLYERHGFEGGGPFLHMSRSLP